jgi:hypothetical protein
MIPIVPIFSFTAELESGSTGPAKLQTTVLGKQQLLFLLLRRRKEWELWEPWELCAGYAGDEDDILQKT